MSEDKKWKVAFFPPDLWDLMRDFIITKGEKEKVYSPKVLAIRAVEDYLSQHGYSRQIEDIRKELSRKLQKPVPRVFSLNEFTEQQREAITYLMKWKEMNEQDAMRWVVEHKEQVEAAIVESEKEA